MKNVLIVLGVIVVIVIAYFGIRSLYKSNYNSPVSTSSTSSTAVATASVNISNFAFDPNDISVTKGQTVTFTNNDSTTHTVTSDTGVFNSGNLAPGKTFSYTFNDTGTFSYHCSIHTMMTGKVEVK
jgi:plastocyanin